MKEYSEFLEEVLEMVRIETGPEYECSIHDVPKNNGITLKTLSIVKKGTSISPCIYLERPYVEYLKGTNIETVASKITNYYFECMKHVPDNISKFEGGLTRGYVMEHLRGRLVNYERNREMLSNVPHRRFLDLAVVYMTDEDDNYVVTMSNEMAEELKIAEAELHAQMLKNMYLYDNWKLSDILDYFEDYHGDIRGDDYGKMYVLTREDKSFGAIEMMRSEVMSDVFGRLGEEFYILPSSIHELIIVPVSNLDEESVFMDAIKSINQMHVEPTDVLSDSLYKYEAEDGKVKIVIKQGL